MKKFWGAKMGFSPQTGLPKSNFLTTHARYTKFSSVGKYEEQIKFDKYRSNKAVSLKQVCQNFELLNR